MVVISPLGLPENIKVFIDKNVMEREETLYRCRK
jgi:prolyl-tRNA editing enzyme YbaK/EbsC (Cys-tRNA(Pro) deacylase)